MGPVSYMRSVVDRNVVMRRIHVCEKLSLAIQFIRCITLIFANKLTVCNWETECSLP